MTKNCKTMFISSFKEACSSQTLRYGVLGSFIASALWAFLAYTGVGIYEYTRHQFNPITCTNRESNSLSVTLRHDWIVEVPKAAIASKHMFFVIPDDQMNIKDRSLSVEGNLRVKKLIGVEPSGNFYGAIFEVNIHAEPFVAKIKFTTNSESYVGSEGCDYFVFGL